VYICIHSCLCTHASLEIWTRKFVTARRVSPFPLSERTRGGGGGGARVHDFDTNIVRQRRDNLPRGRRYPFNDKFLSGIKLGIIFAEQILGCLPDNVPSATRSPEDEGARRFACTRSKIPSKKMGVHLAARVKGVGETLAENERRGGEPNLAGETRATRRRVSGLVQRDR